MRRLTHFALIGGLHCTNGAGQACFSSEGFTREAVNYVRAVFDLLDEPTVGIDPESRNEILETIKSFKKDGKTVVYTSHYMPEIEKICDEVAIINAGRIIRQGSIESMLVNESGNALIIEIYETPLELLLACCDVMDGLDVVDETTLMLDSKESASVAQALALLEADNIGVKALRYGTTTLESLFINLTSKGRADV